MIKGEKKAGKLLISEFLVEHQNPSIIDVDAQYPSSRRGSTHSQEIPPGGYSLIDASVSRIAETQPSVCPYPSEIYIPQEEIDRRPSYQSN